ncbi:MAG: phenylalanine--tRNA ligase subunit beta [Candidatus Izemoplasmatales bacterium]|jgi:phenylalanyl-tRNA synthetase beta chain
MRVSLNWLKELVDINLDYRDLEQKFNLQSAEVSGIYPLSNATNLTVGHVLECVKHPDADKLSLCRVDIGGETLQIICGAPNVRAGQKVIVALVGSVLPGGLKIKKANIRGVESNGMICSLDELGIEHKYHSEDGIHVLPDETKVGADPLKVMCLDDYVMELDLTPNRSDLLSIIGVAYDVAAMTAQKVSLPETDFKTVSERNPISVFTETNGCMSYYGQTIKNIKVGKSPYWLQSRLIACGIRPINNVVDITNYVMLEYGNPLHAFDCDKLGSNQIIVRDAVPNEKITTLDDKERVLESNDMVITNGQKPIAIAGVMGGLDTEVDENTTTVFLEAATFDPIRIRKTSKRLGLRSESSIRFERGLDPKNTLQASLRAIDLLQDLCGGEVMKFITYFDTNDMEDKEIKLSLEKLEKTTGLAFSAQDVETIWDNLGFGYSSHDNEYKVKVPSRRQDITTYQDLIEEVVRLYGYDKILTTTPKTATIGQLSSSKQMVRKLRGFMTAYGFDETITYSLVTRDKAVMFDMVQEEPISILNPLSEERACLRHSLLPSLIGVAKYNLARNIDDLKLFEIGNSYHDQVEPKLFAGLTLGKYRPSIWQKDEDKVDFYLLKGIVESSIKALGYREVTLIKMADPHGNLHPKVAATILVEGNNVGFIARLHPEVEHREELPETYVFEISLDEMMKIPVSQLTMKQLSRFPAVSRDLALVISEQAEASLIVNTIKSTNIKALRQVEVFDVYQGDNLPSDHKSLAVKLTFQLDDKTLSTEEIDGFIQKIIKKAASIGAKLR